MRPILTRKVLEQYGQDNAADRAVAVETACLGFAHFPLIFRCLDAVLLIGSGSLWESTMPSSPVLSESLS